MGDMTYLQGGGKAPWRAVGDSQAKPSLIGNEFHGDLVMISALEYGCCLNHSGTFSSTTWRLFFPLCAFNSRGKILFLAFLI